MKSTLIAITSIICCNSALGASLTVNNITGSGNDIAFGDAGGLLTSGFVAVYTFSTLPSSVAELQSADPASQLGIIVSINGAPDPGAFTSDFTLTNDAVQPLFIVVGNGASPAASTALALFDSGLSLDGDDSGSPTGDSLLYNIMNPAELVPGFGNINRGDVDWSNTVGANYNTNILTLAPVPEPSSALLASLGLLALSARRSRK